MKSVPKGLLAALAGLAVVVALPYILAWEPPGKAGGSAVEGMETVALTSALPEGYRVDTGGEVRFVSPEEVLAGLAAPEWDGLRGEEGAELVPFAGPGQAFPAAGHLGVFLEETVVVVEGVHGGAPL